MTVSRVSHDKRPSNQLQHFPLKQWWTFGTVYTINKIILILPTLLKFYWDSSLAECCSVLCPFLTKMSIIYRWNQHQMFYLQSSLDVAYHISMRIYKLFNLASLPKNDFTLVLYCSMSILNQWNANIKKKTRVMCLAWGLAAKAVPGTGVSC